MSIKIKFYLNSLINKAESLTTSGDISLKPCRKIDNVDLSDNSPQFLMLLICLLYFPEKDKTFYFFENFYKVMSTFLLRDCIKNFFY